MADKNLSCQEERDLSPQNLLTSLRLAGMATEDAERQRTRRGYWLRLARRRSTLTLHAVAAELGYSSRSSSTIKFWEDGKRDPSDIQLSRIAALYKVPAEVFFDPAQTDEERLEEWVRAGVEARARGRDDVDEAGRRSA